MRIKVLVDNNTFIDRYYYGEPALSFYIEDSNTKILFDTGYSNIVLTNSKKMNIDLKKIDYLIISHGHNDHTGGLKYLNDGYLSNVKLVSHKDAFIKRFNDNIDIGSPISLDNLKIKEYIDGTNGYKITENLFFLGQIPRTFEYENNIIGNLNNGDPDNVLDDSALVYKNNNELFIITGCSHSGICNIIEQSKKITGINKIKGIIGGFHLFEKDEKLQKTIEYFINNDIKNLYPCHCVSQTVKCELSKYFNVAEVAVDFELEI